MNVKSSSFVAPPHCTGRGYVALSWTPDGGGGWRCPSCDAENQHARDQYRYMQRAVARGIRRWRKLELEGGETP